MCGISGYVQPTASADQREAAVRRMCRAMINRGPDDEGLVSRGPTTLGMRRLAIFDPAHGHQPMATREGRFHLVFNGAIYNFRELRGELQKLGHAFLTECDTEVLLASFAQWGEGCLKRLRGMFAFAVWDDREQSLFLARDPFGIKPLYFSRIGAGLVFASEIHALLASDQCSREIDAASVSSSLAYLAVPAPATIYRNIRSLRPGECGFWRASEMTLRTYWNFSDLASAHASPCGSRPEFIEQLRLHLENTIAAHSFADVPVGAFLSGGLDSAAVVGLMTRQSSAKLKTFSIVFNESEFSEESAAEATAKHFGTEHHARCLTGDEVAGDIEKILASFDQPTGDAINTYYASQFARAGGVKAALSGLGGDEVFGGYPSFKNTPRLARALPLWRVLPQPIRRTLLERFQNGDARKRKLAEILAHASNLHEVAALQRVNLPSGSRTSLLSVDTTFFPHSELAHLTDELRHADPFQVVSGWELRTYMADVLLRDSDAMSMANSLELRVPFVDRPLIEWYWAQPTYLKTAGVQPKFALSEALKDVLPPHLTNRPKQGFTLPFARWMKGPLRPFLDETFSDASVGKSGLFNSVGVQSMWRNYLAQDDAREWSRIWNLGVVIAFINRSSRPTG